MTDRKLKTIILVSGTFPGIADSAGLRMYYRHTTFTQNRFSHFWENKKNSCEEPLILGIGG